MQAKIIIENKQKQTIFQQLKRVWEFRELLWVFTKRDIKVQYAQTRLGALWSFLQAIVAAAIVYFFFGVLMNVQTKPYPYLIFAFPGMIAWYYFSNINAFAGSSLIQSQHIIKKIYFPKLILPISKSLVGMFDLMVWFLVYLFFCILYSHPLSIKLLFFPLAVFFNMIAGLSIAIWMSAISIKRRDALMIIPYLIGFGIFVTPVFFPTTMVPEQYHFFIYFNPMAGVVAFYRWIFMDYSLSIYYLLGFIPIFVLLGFGLHFFKKMESVMADWL